MMFVLREGGKYNHAPWYELVRAEDGEDAPKPKITGPVEGATVYRAEIFDNHYVLTCKIGSRGPTSLLGIEDLVMGGRRDSDINWDYSALLAGKRLRKIALHHAKETARVNDATLKNLLGKSKI